ncbi:hypothetical protein BLNAU_16972 [Blattamonas nauphoetae]|uniref:Uncharacterized protein n=1 Tax=Blattamonas nauphoetae TaxID=2049346 RepID=A0ABQ9XB49_9EUKA|nr:hypothetical protein BLNAU_16972 [Blattamonas nauphoetae]
MSQKDQGHEIDRPLKEKFQCWHANSQYFEPVVKKSFQDCVSYQHHSRHNTSSPTRGEITDHFDEFNTNLKKAESILQTEKNNTHQFVRLETKAGIKKATAGHLALTIENGILPAALPECGKQEFKLTTVAATSNTEFVNQGYIFKWTHFAGTIDVDFIFNDRKLLLRPIPPPTSEITDGGRFTIQAFKDAEGAKSISSVVAALVLVLALEQLICGSVCGHKAHKRFDSDMSIRRRNGQSGECQVQLSRTTPSVKMSGASQSSLANGTHHPPVRGRHHSFHQSCYEEIASHSNRLFGEENQRCARRNQQTRAAYYLTKLDTEIPQIQLRDSRVQTRTFNLTNERRCEVALDRHVQTVPENAD